MSITATSTGDGTPFGARAASPLGWEVTLTTGVVSALHRQITAPNGFSISDAIQTDAELNPATRAARC